MAAETLRPNGELSDAGLVANSELDHDDDPDVSSATVNATGNNVDTEWGGDFPTPAGDPNVGAGLQEFRVGVEEFDSGQSGTPDARIELWENGSLVRAGSDTPVSTYAVLSFTWDASELATADGSLVQCKLIGTRSGGGPSARNTVRIGHMEWNADVTVPLENGVDFDGTNDWLGPEDTTGESDSKSILISGWVKPNGKQGTPLLTDITGTRFQIQFRDGGTATTNDLEIKASNSTPSLILSQRTDNLLVADQWNHFLFNFDLATATAQGYINDTAVTFDGGGTLTNDTIDFTHATGLALCANIAGGLKYNGAVQELWIGFGQNIDISVEANRRKFIDAGGDPVTLGVSGEIPTGTQPTVYLRKEFSTFQDNLGSLGGFTENGTLTDEGTLPSLPAVGADTWPGWVQSRGGWT